MNDDKPIRLRPRRPRRQSQDESKTWAKAFKSLIHIVRMTSKATAPGRAGNGRTGRAEPSHRQRCAVRITYSGNRVRGQWGAHGRYLMRDNALQGAEGELGSACGPSGPVADLPAKLQEWQSARDPRLFKLIVSPEFGDRVGLEHLVRELMRRMEADLGRKLEWAAVNHHNTEHPHAHIVLRGMADGQELRLGRDYVKNGVRRHADNICTEQLGFRTPADAALARDREVDQARFTSLDRQIASRRPGGSEPTFRIAVRASEQHSIGRRLFTLHKLGLATQCGRDQWEVQREFDAVLRTMQTVTDRQRMVATHAELMSKPGLPIQYTQPAQIDELRGRVIAHRLDDSSGRPLMILESNDGIVHLIPHDAVIERGWARGQLVPGRTIVMTRQDDSQMATFRVEDAHSSSRTGDRSNGPAGRFAAENRPSRRR
jgi:type IV secretory pathway VirD2 relaxase